MKITGRGGIKVRLDEGEASILGWLLDELRGIVAAVDGTDDVWHRLYPDAYDEPADAAEYRSMTEAPLRSDRLERIDACRAELASGEAVLRLDAGSGDRWLRVLNDVRLALGTQLGITEDWDHEADPDDPAQFPHAAYVWLTGAQDALVRALSR